MVASLSDAIRAARMIRSVSAVVVLSPLLGGCRDARVDAGSPAASARRSASAPMRSSDIPAPAKVADVPWRSPPQLGVGPGGSCAIAGGGHVYCWGIELGPKPGSLPALLLPSQPFEQIHVRARRVRIPLLLGRFG